MKHTEETKARIRATVMAGLNSKTEVEELKKEIESLRAVKDALILLLKEVLSGKEIK